MEENPNNRRRNRLINPDDNDSDTNSNAPSEAEEEKNILDQDANSNVSEEPEGDNLMENLEEDYKPIPELDRFEQDGIDDESVSENLDFEARREAEEQIEQRNKLSRQQKDQKRFKILGDISDSDDDEIRLELRRQKQRDHWSQQFEDEEDEEDKQFEEGEQYIDFEHQRGKLHQWINDPRTKRYIIKTFKHFLYKFRLEQQNQQQKPELVYLKRIQEMCSYNKQSLEITYSHIRKNHEKLAEWIAEEPSIILPHLNQIAFDVVMKNFSTYANIHSEIYVRIKDLPLIENIRDLRQNHLNKLIKVRGVVTRRSPVFSQLKRVLYVCNKCGERKGPIFVNNNEEVKLGVCSGCQSKGPFMLDQDSTLYRNYQKITIQESPSSVPPGRVPRQKDVVLLGDNIDIARPGDEVEITGIYIHRYDYALNVKHGFPIFQTLIEANYLERVADTETTQIPEEDIKEIQKLAKKENIDKLIISSIAPAIYGHHHVKTALALAMFGGEQKDVGGKHRIRGDINVLILGDPGVAKSQFLKSVEKIFYRSVYTTGKGASAVGLTASVKKDPATKEWTLEGGALVLADKGICLIDEFDKMNEHDRTSIHEAMEQQSISISKAGIVASLQARCSVIAVANPIKGKYDSQLSFKDNVDLTDPILSRFDVLCVVKDEVQINQDLALASFVVNSHIKSHPYSREKEEENPEEYMQYLLNTLVEEPEKKKEDMISQALLKKYIMYARQKKHPRISDINKEKITKFYTDLRQESNVSGGLNIAVRHIESIIRMAEARAKMFLRDYVRNDDIDMAISVMLESFVQSQKFSVAKTIMKKFQHYITFREDYSTLLNNMLNKMFSEQMQFKLHIAKKKDITVVKVHKSFLEKEAKKKDIHSIEDYFSTIAFQKSFKLQEDGFIVSLF